MKRIFLYWAQGWNQAPELVLRVRDTWAFHNPHWEVVTLDDANLSQWIDVPTITSRPENLTVQAASDVIRMNLLHRYGGVWADATMLCARPLDEWVDAALAPEGFWMYHGGPGGRYAALFFLVSAPESLIVSRWKDAIDKFWAAPHDYAYQWVDHLFLNLLRTDPQFRASWSRVPYQWCDRPGSAHTLGDYGVCFGPPDQDLLRSVQDTVPFAIKLNWRGQFHPNTNGAHILDWALTTRTGPPVTWEEPPVLDTLKALFNMYGTDKGSPHGYDLVYEPLLRDRRESVQHVLEVGIGTLSPGAPSSMAGYAEPWYSPGGSLRAWRDYFPNAVIWGLDTQPDTQADHTFGDRIVTKLADSTDNAQVDAAVAGLSFDLIIDDGLHTFEAQVATLRNLWPRVKPGGYYVVEDMPFTAAHIFDSGVLDPETLAGATVHADNKLLVIPRP